MKTDRHIIVHFLKTQMDTDPLNIAWILVGCKPTDNIKSKILNLISYENILQYASKFEKEHQYEWIPEKCLSKLISDINTHFDQSQLFDESGNIKTFTYRVYTNEFIYTDIRLDITSIPLDNDKEIKYFIRYN